MTTGAAHSPMDAIEILLRLIGAFYVFAAFVAARASVMSLLIDRAIAAIALERLAISELLKSYWLLAASLLVMVGGAALLFLIDIAVWAFLASAIGQAAYLFYLAPRYFDAEDPPDETGRRQTTNAFVVYLIATAVVVWAYGAGYLRGVGEVSWPTLIVPAAIVGAHIAYIVRHVSGSASDSGLGAHGDDEDGGDRNGDDSVHASRPLSDATRVKVMADYGCHPLWAMDEDLCGDIAPEALQLSSELVRDFHEWAQAYDASLNSEDPADSLWSDSEHEDHMARGRPLAIRLARERPDLVVYVMDPKHGLVEVHEDDEGSVRT